ncbi:MAG: hypothetical protein RMI90_10035 [Thermoguttaceae bacterium]|nr:hypothetical protein [Thermoguttaceae bacterium]
MAIRTRPNPLQSTGLTGPDPPTTSRSPLAQAMDARKANVTQPLSTQALPQQLAGRWFLCHPPETWIENLKRTLGIILHTAQTQFSEDVLLPS